MNPEIPRPILRRTVRQTLGLTAATVITLSVSSHQVARALLLERAELHVATLNQATVDLVEQELRDMRHQALAVVRDVPHGGSGDMLHALRADYPALMAVAIEPEARGETAVRTGIDHNGWNSVTVLLPQDGATAAVTFSTASLLERLAAAARASGRTADILFGREENGDLQILRVTEETKRAALTLGSLQSQRDLGLMIARATDGERLRGRDEDYRGVRVVSAGSDLPSLGWGVTAQMDADDVLAGVRMLGLLHVLIGTAFLLLAAVAAAWLARRLTAPLRRLAGHVAVLGPGHWDLRPSLHTGDEVALLERVMADMASRLRAFTERLEQLVRQRTEALRQQYALDRTVLHAVEYGVVTVDRTGCVTGMNPAAERLLGKRADEALAMRAEAVLPLSVDGTAVQRDAHPLRVAVLQAHAVHTAPGSAWTLSVPGRDDRDILLTATPLATDGTPFGAVAVFQDITRERQMEQLKSEFITLASHQLRTPLSIMQWQVESLRGAERVEPGAVDDMDAAAKRMTAIVNALVQVASLEGGSLTPTYAQTDLATLLQQAVRDGTVGENRGVTVSLAAPQTLPCSTDAVFVGIAVRNLLENAVKYSRDNGAVAISAADNGDRIAVCIRDAGMGIPAEEQRHVFEKFFRGKNVRKSSTDGTGLGLYIAKMITEQLGGTITFVSAEGSGTAFTMELPKEPKTTPSETR